MMRRILTFALAFVVAAVLVYVVTPLYFGFILSFVN